MVMCVICVLVYNNNHPVLYMHGISTLGAFINIAVELHSDCTLSKWC